MRNWGIPLCIPILIDEMFIISNYVLSAYFIPFVCHETVDVDRHAFRANPPCQSSRLDISWWFLRHEKLRADCWPAMIKHMFNINIGSSLPER